MLAISCHLGVIKSRLKGSYESGVGSGTDKDTKSPFSSRRALCGIS